MYNCDPSQSKFYVICAGSNKPGQCPSNGGSHGRRRRKREDSPFHYGSFPSGSNVNYGSSSSPSSSGIGGAAARPTHHGGSSSSSSSGSCYSDQDCYSSQKCCQDYYGSRSCMYPTYYG
jgi:hypothetical protein